MLTNCKVSSFRLFFAGETVELNLSEEDKKKIVSLIPGKFRVPEVVGRGEVLIKFDYQEWGQDETNEEAKALS